MGTRVMLRRDVARRALLVVETQAEHHERRHAGAPVCAPDGEGVRSQRIDGGRRVGLPGRTPRCHAQRPYVPESRCHGSVVPQPRCSRGRFAVQPDAAPVAADLEQEDQAISPPSDEARVRDACDVTWINAARVGRTEGARPNRGRAAARRNLDRSPTTAIRVPAGQGAVPVGAGAERSASAILVLGTCKGALGRPAARKKHGGERLAVVAEDHHPASDLGEACPAGDLAPLGGPRRRARVATEGDEDSAVSRAWVGPVSWLKRVSLRGRVDRCSYFAFFRGAILYSGRLFQRKPTEPIRQIAAVLIGSELEQRALLIGDSQLHDAALHLVRGLFRSDHRGRESTSARAGPPSG